MEKLTLASLFAGIGGFELASERQGIETKWNCEIEEKNRAVLKKHFPLVKQYDDIKTVKNPEKVNIITGGFPCQDISIANVSNKKIWKNGKCIGIKGERSGLWNEMFRVIREVKPEYIIIENSPMLLIRGFDKVLSDLTKAGYVCEWQCLQATQFGYNHKRERLFAIAYTKQIRRKNTTTVFKELSKVLYEQSPRQIPVSIPLKRFKWSSSYEHVRMDDGFSTQLDVTRIEQCGNAVVVDIACYLLECIKIHYKKYKYENTRRNKNNH